MAMDAADGHGCCWCPWMLLAATDAANVHGCCWWLQMLLMVTDAADGQGCCWQPQMLLAATDAAGGHGCCWWPWMLLTGIMKAEIEGRRGWKHWMKRINWLQFCKVQGLYKYENIISPNDEVSLMVSFIKLIHGFNLQVISLPVKQRN